MVTDDAKSDYNKVQDADSGNQAELSHELLAGGASFYAMHEFENYQRKQGKQQPCMITSTSTFTIAIPR